VIVLLIAAMLIAGLTWFAWHQQWLKALPSFFYQTLIFLVFSTALIYGYLYKVSKPDFFVQLYLLTMAVKLMAYAAYNLLMVLKDQAGATLNVVFFMGAYFIFTFLEIRFLYRKISRS
jgi:hypothetical protein